MSKIRSRTAMALILATLASCATPTPYRPQGAGYDRTGYSDYQIESNRFRVSFAGNSMTSRETVERYLLYRAAELTLERGNDWFVMADRNTERRSNTYIDRPFSSGDFGYWGPAWRYRSAGFGWRTWDPYWGDPFWDSSIDVHTVDRYEATAEIVVGRGAKPAEDRRAFDAHEVVNRLRDTIQPG
ncbi:MAG: hypothetical protein ABIM50_08840 [Novosphingobium sp.]